MALFNILIFYSVSLKNDCLISLELIMAEYLTLINGQWIKYIPLEGVDSSFTESAFMIGAIAYGNAILAGKPILEAHNKAEAAMFESQRSFGNIIKPRTIRKNRNT